MTADEVGATFEIIWNGGELLPPHDSRSTLTEAVMEPKRKYTKTTERRHVGRQHDKAVARQRIALEIQHLRGTCSEREIARRLGLAREFVRRVAKRFGPVARPRRYRSRPTWAMS